jgi:hypothetical protein
MPRRPGYATVKILKALDNGYRHGFDIIDATGLPGQQRRARSRWRGTARR